MISIAELAKALGADAAGDEKLMVSGAAEPGTAQRHAVALAMSPEFADELKNGAAEAAILWPDADWQAMGLKAAIFAPRPRYVLSGVTEVFDHPLHVEDGISSMAVIDPSAEIGEGASIGPFVVIGGNVKIGRGCRILPHVMISENVEIGDDALLHAGVKIGARVRIGDRFIAQPGAVLGGDGFSFVTPTPGVVDEARSTGAITSQDQESYVRINSLGAVVVGDDVEVGANSCIDRGTIRDTSIGNGTKIDNLVQIGHNVQVGHTCLICGHSGIGGSTRIGDRVVIGGAASIADHLHIGNNSVITGNSGVASNVGENRIMMGYPAVRMDQNVSMYKALRRLPRILDKFMTDQKQVP